MAIYRYHLVNVFAETPLSGNALAVFEDAQGLDDATMLAITRQLNLPEVSFLFEAEQAHARIRIFTPAYEMPFAGHPTLGSAHVVARLRQLDGTRLNIETAAGVIPLWRSKHDVWTFQAKTPTYRACELSNEQLAAILGLAPADLGGTALFVNTGTEQLVVPLASRDAVLRCTPKAHVLDEFVPNREGRAQVCVWHRDEVLVNLRFFYTDRGALAEDHGTGSACANLGGWLLANGAPRPINLDVRQGHTIKRISHLKLEVNLQRQIFVGGRVVHLGTGNLSL